jgi:hypothetical protein
MLAFQALAIDEMDGSPPGKGRAGGAKSRARAAGPPVHRALNAALSQNEMAQRSIPCLVKK